MHEGLEHLNFVSQIHDPIWGAFPITALEKEVLDSPEVSRLQHIKQMGLAFLDYTGLTHTRLEHSLGVMYVADQMFTILRETARQTFRKDEDREILLRLFNPENHQAVRLAALLHDLGHPPFSHAVELTFLRYPGLLQKARRGLRQGDSDKAVLFDEYSHEAFTRWIISKSEELRPLLESGFENNARMVDEIADLAVGKAKGDLEPFNTIISGDFDADRIDYLIRDNRHSGFSIGLSPDELNNAVHIRPEDSGAPRRFEIYIDRNALHFVNSLLSARERLIQRVHLAPLGRAATQMLTSFLFDDLNQIGDDVALANTIINLHKECTDYTFVKEIDRRRRLPWMRTSRYATVADFIDAPSKRKVWKEYAHLGFMRMHPSLRLLAYVSATAKYKTPDDLFKGDLFIEPSARPAPKFSLRVDYDCRPEDPSFDFIAASENRQGRAILGQSLSNLDVFAYLLDAEHSPVVAEGLGNDGLTGAERLLARRIEELARDVRRERYENHLDAEGMLPPDFLLTVLYCLDQNISETFPGSRSIYVFSAEAFINSFLRSLACAKQEKQEKQEGWPLPKEIVQGDGVNANRVFSYIQRLNVFGLVETRQRPTFHAPGGSTISGAGRTRTRIYGTREDFRISHWGKHYVQTQIDDALVLRIRDLIRMRQSGVISFLEEMERVYPKDVSGGSGAETLVKFFAESARIAQEIGARKGCAMIFRLP